MSCRARRSCLETIDAAVHERRHEPVQDTLLGREKRDDRGPTSPEVMRVSQAPDLDSVGPSHRHHVFEMLGNFSNSDYFKKRRCPTPELLTGVWNMPKDSSSSRFSGARTASRDDGLPDLASARHFGGPHSRLGSDDNPGDGRDGPCGGVRRSRPQRHRIDPESRSG